MIIPTTLTRCACSDDQLTYVGCDCDAAGQPLTIIEAWPRGYAHEAGPARICTRLRTHTDVSALVRERLGRAAVAFSVYEPRPMPPIDPAHARAMSQNDNS